MKHLKLIVMALILIMSFSINASDHKCKSGCKDKHTHVCTITNVVTVTRIVNVTNVCVRIINTTNVITVIHPVNVTNLSVRVITVTNVVTEVVTNVINTGTVNMPSTDYNLVKSHVYKLIVSSDTSTWKTWGIIRSTSNQTARVIIPLDLVKPLYWQLIDVTPGYPRTAVIPIEFEAVSLPTYIALSYGRLYRVPDANRP